jgi:branched-chain amino acid transport system permease protein
MRAIAESPDTARLLGVDTNRIVPALFVISGMFTALGGILFAANYLQVSPFIGNEVALKGVAAMIIGGMGNMIFASLLAFLCLRPTGLYGDRAARAQRV